MNDLDRLAINTIRTLSIDAVQQANSGHPGTPMALAPLVYALWNRIMRFDPKHPIWPNRDRFVLSNGHASMLLWSVLHLSDTRAVNADYERLGEPSVTLDDIRHFRQLDSKAPGHPEYHWVSGVETTTGPLGQGIATSVGMAIARKWLGSRSASPAAPCPRSDPGPVAFLEGLLDAGAPAPGSAPAPDETASVQDRAKSLERIARELELPPLAGAGVVVCLMG